MIVCGWFHFNSTSVRRLLLCVLFAVSKEVFDALLIPFHSVDVYYSILRVIFPFWCHGDVMISLCYLLNRLISFRCGKRILTVGSG